MKYVFVLIWLLCSLEEVLKWYSIQKSTEKKYKKKLRQICYLSNKKKILIEQVLTSFTFLWQNLRSVWKTLLICLQKNKSLEEFWNLLIYTKKQQKTMLIMKCVLTTKNFRNIYCILPVTKIKQIHRENMFKKSNM